MTSSYFSTVCISEFRLVPTINRNLLRKLHFEIDSNKKMLCVSLDVSSLSLNDRYTYLDELNFFTSEINQRHTGICLHGI
jgi:hypothetical protein